MSLRLVTWNCHHGELRTRAALLDGLRPDIVALQECSAPVPAGRDAAWEGFSPGKGVGVRVGAGSEVALVSDATAGGRSARLFQVSGAVELQLLVFWAHREPTYVRGVAAALDAYATAIRSAPTVLLGDFNSNTLWDGDEPRPTIYGQRKRSQPYHVDYCFVPEGWVERIDDVAVGGWDDLAAESDHRAMVVAAQDRTSS